MEDESNAVWYGDYETRKEERCEESLHPALERIRVILVFL